MALLSFHPPKSLLPWHRRRLWLVANIYGLYSEEEDFPKIVEVMDNNIDLDLDMEGPANLYLEL